MRIVSSRYLRMLKTIPARGADPFTDAIEGRWVACPLILRRSPWRRVGHEAEPRNERSRKQPQDRFQWRHDEGMEAPQSWHQRDVVPDAEVDGLFGIDAQKREESSDGGLRIGGVIVGEHKWI